MRSWNKNLKNQGRHLNNFETRENQKKIYLKNPLFCCKIWEVKKQDGKVKMNN